VKGAPSPFIGGPLFDAVWILSPAWWSSALVLGFPEVFGGDGPISPVAWLLLVLLIDVAHVHSTWFRTYFDRAEFARRAGLYVSVPVLGWALGVAIHSTSSALFWTLLAYLAAFHFVRQQYGFLKIYSRSEIPQARWKSGLDAAAIYLATLYPLLDWHAHLESRKFHWFLEGDFLPLPIGEGGVALARAAWALGLGAFFVSEAVLAFRRRRLAWAKVLLVGGTALSWWVGIVGTSGDLPFTLTNVVPHGLPYFALLWKSGQRAGSRGLFQVRFGWVLLFTGALALAFLEEGFWAGWIWREGYGVFGAFLARLSPVQDAKVTALLVPLLALPQIVHYVLDGWIWRGPRSLYGSSSRSGS
jgi:hypothetical protein